MTCNACPVLNVAIIPLLTERTGIGPTPPLRLRSMVRELLCASNLRRTNSSSALGRQFSEARKPLRISDSPNENWKQRADFNRLHPKDFESPVGTSHRGKAAWARKARLGV